MHTCNLSYTRGIGRRIQVQDQTCQKAAGLVQKFTEAKRTRGVAEMVECNLLVQKERSQRRSPENSKRTITFSEI
jgi:hypothetical protein